MKVFNLDFLYKNIAIEKEITNSIAVFIKDQEAVKLNDIFNPLSLRTVKKFENPTNSGNVLLIPYLKKDIQTAHPIGIKRTNETSINNGNDIYFPFHKKIKRIEITMKERYNITSIIFKYSLPIFFCKLLCRIETFIYTY